MIHRRLFAQKQFWISVCVMTKRFNKIYLEISNICNLRCAFCPGTKREKHAMTEAEFSALLPKLRTLSDFLYIKLISRTVKKL